MKKRTILKVIKQGTKWIVKSSRLIDGWTVDDSPKSYAQAVDLAFKHAKKIKGAIVRLYDAKGNLEVEIDAVGVANYVPA